MDEWISEVTRPLDEWLQFLNETPVSFSPDIIRTFDSRGTYDGSGYGRVRGPGAAGGTADGGGGQRRGASPGRAQPPPDHGGRAAHGTEGTTARTGLNRRQSVSDSYSPSSILRHPTPSFLHLNFFFCIRGFEDKCPKYGKYIVSGFQVKAICRPLKKSSRVL